MIADTHAEVGAYSRYNVFAYEVVARHKADTGLNTESPSFAIAILRNGGVDKAVELTECHVFVLAASDDLIVFCEISIFSSLRHNFLDIIQTHQSFIVIAKKDILSF